MKKKITLIGVNYYPEDSAIGLYSTQLTEELVKRGYEVSVITAFPYYPQWEISESYKNHPKFHNETINDVSVYRYKMYVPKNPTFGRRILHILSFTMGNFINLFKLGRQDIVIAIVPFTSSVFLGWLLKLRYSSKLWVHIQDFEFDAAIDSGVISKNKALLIKPLFSFEKWLLNRANMVSTISLGMLDKLKSKSKSKSYLLTNWLDIEKFRLNHPEPHRHLTSNSFKILYSGNIGAKQDWDVFFELMDKIKIIPNLEVIVVGEGALKDVVCKRIENYNFIKHYDLVPFSELPSLLYSADLHVLLQKEDVIDIVMPSKILGMMGSGRPSLVTGNKKSEVRAIIDQSKGGYYFSNAELDKMQNVIENLVNNPKLKEEIGQSAKTYVEKNYAKENVLNDFVEELKLL
ncbi:MAG: hypothetical protein BM564_02240 [Bacteroidetes bacterium MedPE-SWsnd-G2]|nr:MAG: hypothetical protein BM564_02240 [Bacteroidetes bacterium MedPE-SWsnd-G2]